MEKNNYGTNNYATNNFSILTPPNGTATTSGVTVGGPASSGNTNYNVNTNSFASPPPPPPPTYDQATGNAVTTQQITISSSGHIGVQNSNIYPGYNAACPPPRPPQPQIATPISSSTYVYSTPPGVNIHQPMGGQPSLVVIQQQQALPLGPEPVYVTCPTCHAQKLTRIEFEPSSRTHLMAALLCLFGLWCCVCLPYCAGSCMNTHHYCGNCGKFLGCYGNTL